MNKLLSVNLIVLACTAACTAGVVRYRVSTVGFDYMGEGPVTDPADINTVGQICGEYQWDQLRAVRWDPQGAETNLGSLASCPDPGAVPKGINNLGQIVGVGLGENCENEAWFWSAETGMIGMGFLPGEPPHTQARAINDLNQAVGFSSTNAGYHAFIWHPNTGIVSLADQPNGIFMFAYDINNAAAIIGEAFTGQVVEGVIWTPAGGMERLGDLHNGGSSASIPYAINQLGEVVGGASSPQGYQAFLRDAQGQMIGLGFLFDSGEPGEFSIAFDVNDRREVVGVASYNTIDRPFVWDEHRGMRNINTLIDPCALLPNRILLPNAINNAGQIVGRSTNAGPAPGIMLTPYLPGDLDEDGDVQLDDLAVLLAHFGTTENALYAEGDIEDCDGDVDLRDLVELLANFGETYP